MEANCRVPAIKIYKKYLFLKLPFALLCIVDHLQYTKLNSKLSNISEIRFGFHEKPTAKGTAFYLQVKDFDTSGHLKSLPDSLIELRSKNEAYLLKDGDILLAGKGTRNFAWCYRSKLGEAIASSTFFVIRPDLQLINPEYLTSIFNLQQSQLQFQQMGKGSSIQSIGKNELAEFKVPVIPMHLQEKVVQITELHHQEVEILQSLIQSKKELYREIINKTIK